MLKFNKTVKTQIIEAAISAKYKPLFEKAMRELSVAAREWAVKNSLHDLAIKSPPELLPFINSNSYVSLDNSKYIPDVYRLLNHDSRHISGVWFDDPVYTSNKYLPADFPQQLKVFAIVDECESTLSSLSSVVHSYTKAEKLFDDLPWIKEFYPNLPVTGTSLVASEQIAKLNEVMGS